MIGFDTKIETMSLAERENYHNEKVRWVVEYAYQNAPAMREKMDEAGINPAQIQAVKDMEKIPVTKKDDLIRLQEENPPFGGLLGVPFEEVKGIFVSPGPIYDPFGNEVYTRTERILYAMLNGMELLQRKMILK